MTRSPAVTPPSDPVTRYAELVEAGEIVAGPYVRLACRRHLTMLESQGPVWRWDPAMAQVWIDFFPDLLTVEEQGETVPFQLLDWQVFVAGSLNGWRDAQTGHRLYSRAYVEGGKGCGKSPFAAGIGLLMMVHDGEAKAEIYSAAAKKDQAHILFQDAVSMKKTSPLLNRRLVESGKTPVWQLTHRQSGSIFKPQSADKAKSGLRSHCVLIDELHEHKDRYTIDMSTASFKGRRQPLLFIITNSGFDRSSICWEWHEDCVAVLEGLRQNDRLFAYIMALDPEDDPLEDESCWAKTNPGLGVTITEQYLRDQVRDARQVPGRENVVRRLNFCEWCLTPDTMIALASGARVAAADLKAGDMIVAFDEAADRLAPARVRLVKSNGIKPVYAIETHRGRRIRVTEDHRFWARGGRTDSPSYGWIRAADLVVGSRVAVGLDAPLIEPDPLDPGEAHFLGLMVGDGTCVGTPRITTLDPEVVEACRRAAEIHGCILTPLPDGYHWSFGNAERRRGVKTGIRRLLDRHGLSGQISTTKRIPKTVMAGGRAALAAFLSGFLDSDGDVGRRLVRWTSCNRELLADAQHALAMIGIQGALNQIRSGQFRLEVRDGRSLRRAAELLTPVVARKKSALCELLTIQCSSGPCANDRQRFDRIVAVSLEAPVETVGIEVEGLHTHVTAGLVTHNTDADVGWLTRKAWVENEEQLVEYQLPGQTLGRHRLEGGGFGVAEDFTGAECYGGIDLSYAFDLTAIALAFPEGDQLLTWIEYFKPLDTLEAAEKRDRVPYRQWVKEGLITAVPGKVIRPEHLAPRLARIREQFDLRYMAYDNYAHKALEDQMIEAGVPDLPWIEHPQGFRRAGQLKDRQGNPVRGPDGKPLDNPLWMPDSVNQLEGRIIENRIRVQPSKVTRWQVSSVAIRQDPAGTGNRVFDKKKAVGRIDGIVALAQAVGAAEMRLPVLDLSGFLQNPVVVRR